MLPTQADSSTSVCCGCQITPPLRSPPDAIAATSAATTDKWSVCVKVLAPGVSWYCFGLMSFDMTMRHRALLGEAMEQRVDFQKRAIALILPELPANAEKVVANALRRHEDAVRRQIRSETGLRLSDARLKNNVPVRVEPGFPDRLAQLISDNDDPELWRLIMMRPQLDAACGGLDSLLQSWSRLEHWTNLPIVARNDFGRAADITAMTKFDPIRKSGLADQDP
jgi:hypothetical protein